MVMACLPEAKQHDAPTQITGREKEERKGQTLSPGLLPTPRGKKPGNNHLHGQAATREGRHRRTLSGRPSRLDEGLTQGLFVVGIKLAQELPSEEVSVLCPKRGDPPSE